MCLQDPLYTHPSCVVPMHSSQVDELQKTLAFVSISTDGDVLLWTLAKCELLPERLIRLQPATAHKTAGTMSLPGSSSSGAASSDELMPQQHIEGGLCMDFCKVRTCISIHLTISCQFMHAC